MEEKEKKLALMRFWMFGTVVIVFVAVSVYVGGALGIGLKILATPSFWAPMGIISIISVLFYYLYKLFLNRGG